MDPAIFLFRTLTPWESVSGASEIRVCVFLDPFCSLAAKSLQSCLTLCDPRDGSPPGSPVPGTLPARTLEWVAISFSNAWKWKVKVKPLSHVWLLATPWTAAHQAPLSMGFSRQEYRSGVPGCFSPVTASFFHLQRDYLSPFRGNDHLHYLIWYVSTCLGCEMLRFFNSFNWSLQVSFFSPPELLLFFHLPPSLFLSFLLRYRASLVAQW